MTLYFAFLLSQTAGAKPAWIQSGVTDLKHFAEKARRREQAKSHVENAMRLGTFGRVNIAAQLDESYRVGSGRQRGG